MSIFPIVKPLPLLIVLVILGITAGIFISNNTPDTPSGEHQPSPFPNNPYGNAHDGEDILSIDENNSPFPTPPLLANGFAPDFALVTFVEEQLQAQFPRPPFLTPLSSDQLVDKALANSKAYLAQEGAKRLNEMCERIHLLPSYQPLEQTIATILALEVRGINTSEGIFVVNTLLPDSPPDQAAIVNLLTKQLAEQSLPPLPLAATPDQYLSRHLLLESLAFQTESSFRETLPEYPASLPENTRESVLIGLPTVVFELATSPEFHFYERFKNHSPAKTLKKFRHPTPSAGRSLLAYPLAAGPSREWSFLGSLPLFALIKEATDPTTARTIAISLTHDQVSFAEDNDVFTWELHFSSDNTARRAAEALRKYYSLRDQSQLITLEVDAPRLLLHSAPER